MGDAFDNLVALINHHSDKYHRQSSSLSREDDKSRICALLQERGDFLGPLEAKEFEAEDLHNDIARKRTVRRFIATIICSALRTREIDDRWTLLPKTYVNFVKNWSERDNVRGQYVTTSSDAPQLIIAITASP